MVTFFCPSCWREVAESEVSCPWCAADITEERARTFAEKLITALTHPIPETVGRAAWILGQIRCIRAVAPLGELLRMTTDPFLKLQVLDSLEKIGTLDATEIIAEASAQEEGIVGRHARDIVRRIIDRWITIRD